MNICVWCFKVEHLSYVTHNSCDLWWCCTNVPQLFSGSRKFCEKRQNTFKNDDKAYSKATKIFRLLGFLPQARSQNFRISLVIIFEMKKKIFAVGSLQSFCAQSTVPALHSFLLEAQTLGHIFYSFTFLHPLKSSRTIVHGGNYGAAGSAVRGAKFVFCLSSHFRVFSRHFAT